MKWITRPKFSVVREERVQGVLVTLGQAIVFTPGITHRISTHESDNRFLECAEAAADFLVTGNTRHFPKSWKASKIVNARQFLDVLSSL